MFYDNVLVEFNVATSYSEEQLISNLTDCFTRAVRKLGKYIMVPRASNTYPEKECKHKDALVFGCEPEYCAYEMSIIQPPSAEPGNNFRSGGGHIHLGYKDEEYPLLAKISDDNRNDRDWGRIWVVRMMDLFVGLPSLFIDHDPSSAARRKLYGKAGSHRPKEEYGVEYRATSNFWLASPRLATLVYRLSDFTVDFVRNKRHLELWKDENNCIAYEAETLRKTIDGSDIKSAKSMMEKIVKPLLPANLYLDIFKLSDPVQYNFYREWGLA